MYIYYNINSMIHWQIIYVIIYDNFFFNVSLVFIFIYKKGNRQFNVYTFNTKCTQEAVNYQVLLKISHQFLVSVL